MQNMEFTSEEQEILAEVLHHLIQELDIEVGRTDTHDFKEKLKHRRLVLERILARLTQLTIA
jgi:hypothetical protein